MKILYYDIESSTGYYGDICEFGYLITNERFEILNKENIYIDPNAKFVKRIQKEILSKEESFYYSQFNFNYFYNKIKKLFDEADIVKTDGKNIYQLTNDELIITKAYPANEMKVIERIRFNDGYNQKYSLYPSELYVDEEYIVVIAQTYGNRWVYKANDDMEKVEYRDMAIAAIYDVNTFELVRKVEIEGNYLSSRKIGSAIYLVSNKYMYYRKDIMPLYRDTAHTENYRCIDVAEMCYFPGYEDTSCLIVAGFNLDNDDEVQISSYLGSSSEIYASKNSLYNLIFLTNALIFLLSISFKSIVE